MLLLGGMPILVMVLYGILTHPQYLGNFEKGGGTVVAALAVILTLPLALFLGIAIDGVSELTVFRLIAAVSDHGRWPVLVRLTRWRSADTHFIHTCASGSTPG